MLMMKNMKFKSLLFLCSVSGVLFTQHSFADPTDEAPEVIGIPTAVKILEKDGYYDFRKIKVVREYNEIAVDARNKEGHRVELEMDLYTGEVVQEQLD